MQYIGLQIIATVLTLTGSVCHIFKKKIGWLFLIPGMIGFIILNYLVGLYIATIPCVVTIIISVIGYLKWKKDEKIRKGDKK